LTPSFLAVMAQAIVEFKSPTTVTPELRCDMTMAEEINRHCTDAIADLLFTTDMISTENLRREGIHDAKFTLWAIR